MYRPLQCADFHDKVYTLASLTKGNVFSIDYSISPPELFSRVFTRCAADYEPTFRQWRSFAADCNFQIPVSHELLAPSDRGLVDKITPVDFRATDLISVISLLDWEPCELGLRILRGHMVNRSAETPGTSAEEIAEHRRIRALQPAINYLYEGLYARAKRQPSCDLPALSVSTKDYGDGGGLARFGGPAIDQQKILAPSSSNDAKSHDNNLGGPRILMCKGCRWRNGNIAITWAEVAVGDTLCRISDDCCLILRQHSSITSVIGPAWLSGPHWSSELGLSPTLLARLFIIVTSEYERGPGGSCQALQGGF